MQIYFDFSGYSDMAIGLGKMFGFDFKENFNFPYGATTMQEFWRKWHISLSTWFKEYVYVPLGGNRKGKVRTSFNKMIVFFTTGFWHGAEWSFVVWGLVHGFFLLLEDFLPIKKLPVTVKRIYTLMVVCLTFVIFRADTLTDAWIIIGKMFTDWNFGASQMSFFVRQMTPMFIVAMIVAIWSCVPRYRDIILRLKENQLVAKLMPYVSYSWVYVVLILSMLSLASDGYNPFIYFRF
jgi:alginate O-acetyltransferase complex protein AlgI